MRALIPSLIASCLLAGPVPALAADSQSIGDATFDAVVLRPLGAVSLLVGGILFLPAAALTSPSGSDGIEEATEILITPQWNNLVDRPLGEF